MAIRATGVRKPVPDRLAVSRRMSAVVNRCRRSRGHRYAIVLRISSPGVCLQNNLDKSISEIIGFTMVGRV